MKKDKHIDAMLVEAYQAGDQKAIASLVKRWHFEFCKKAYFMVKDAAASKDIAQESWQTIMDKLHTLEKPSSFKSWALRIVYNKSLDVLRQQSKDRKQETKIETIQVAVDDDYKEDTALKKALLKAIQQLPMHQQIIVRLFYTEDYSLKEISDLLNISVGTAKSRLFHAREKLKLILKDNNYEN
ncbi:RNA polymerase sigma factor [Psychroserpens sp. AS72]|uniref:RNA polymerase sigma factor n=1 Tax=Psychroserpens sp. AS72 TaxID=3135775 RepID=UPI003173C1DD